MQLFSVDDELKYANMFNLWRARLVIHLPRSDLTLALVLYSAEVQVRRRGICCTPACDGVLLQVIGGLVGSTCDTLA